MSSHIRFPVTNERLEAIVRGLDMQQGDTVLAVLGSGDQAFAMLEEASSVLAVDTDEMQVSYAKKRKQILEQGYFDWFLCKLGELDRDITKDKLCRDNYFLQPGRLENIRQKLDKLEIEKGDFAEFLNKKLFSKIYLSNILWYNGNIEYAAACRYLKQVAASLAPDGLLYITNNDILLNSKYYTEAFVHLGEKEPWPAELKQDFKLTEKALEHETATWRPAVYRRIK